MARRKKHFLTVSVGQNSGWAQLGGHDSESLTRPQRGVIGAAGLEARTGGDSRGPAACHGARPPRSGGPGKRARRMDEASPYTLISRTPHRLRPVPSVRSESVSPAHTEGGAGLRKGANARRRGPEGHPGGC